MKMSNISGWKDVFTFTLKQTLKSKAFIIGYIIFIVFALLVIPIMNFVLDSDVEDEDLIKIQKVYVFNETEITNIDFEKVSNLEIAVNNLKFITENKDYDDVLEQIENDDEPVVALKITKDESSYSLHFTKSTSGIVKDSELKLLGSAVQESFEQSIVDYAGVSDEQLKVIRSEVGSRVYNIDSKGNEITSEDTSISYSDYWFLYGIIFVLLMINIMASSKVATSIVTEKSSKVIEQLLTSIKPLAIIVGKVLATLSAVLLQFVSVIILGVVSNYITNNYIRTEKESIIKDYINPDIINNLGIDNIMICLLIIALGFIFYATFAGLIGATASKVEEINESLAIFTFASLIGAYVGMGAAGTLMGAGQNAFVYFALIFPLSSPFIMPGAVLLGKTSSLLIIISMIVLIVSITFLFRFAAKVYETLVLHTGNRISIKELFKIAKISKGGTGQ
ncbi:ABC transporter permease [Herbivorax sp. ANBcel31]|uniref:ABC transporter permease n=1 Tax=Herbivorax sp. ANBcel31 TaxID=3069754 RepID=UPI0027B56D06|nr:ABC transporter permease [Herbivorax sp. ANBcel31]MDQ2088042.1 ABC transporter permease [Herbivorax sp. ANBcel31]